MEKKAVETIQKKLNDFSFTEVIHKENYHGQSWNERDTFVGNNKGCCVACQECAVPADSGKYKGYQLKYVSHGAHALDFCQRMDIEPDDTWNDIPVLFLFENPSVQYDDQYEVHEGKCPAKKWYWLRDGNEEKDFSYPQYFRQGCYGDLVASLIKMFKLGNAYMTNFVKCSMNDEDGKHYLGTAEYNPECIKTCFTNVLQKEIKILTTYKKELVVFAFSNRVYDLAQQYLGNVEGLDYSLCLMPHPASRMANEYRKYVLFGKMYKTLHSKGICCKDALDVFLKNEHDKQIPTVQIDELLRNTLIERFKEVKINRNDVEIKGTKISTVGTGTIKLFSGEIKCKFKLEDGIFEFGYVANADGAFWIWDANKRCFLATAEEVSPQFGKLFTIFQECILGQEPKS